MSTEELQYQSMIADLITKLHAKGSWCGETHVQKTAYMAQELYHADLGFDFVLYRHGPYSFDLHDAIGSMRAYKFLDMEIRPAPYGPSLVLTERGEQLRDHFREFSDRFAKQINWAVTHFGNKTVSQLERLTTAHFVTHENGMQGKSVHDRAQRVHELKSHISVNEAMAAVKSIDATIQELSANA